MPPEKRKPMDQKECREEALKILRDYSEYIMDKKFNELYTLVTRGYSNWLDIWPHCIEILLSPEIGFTYKYILDHLAIQVPDYFFLKANIKEETITIPKHLGLVGNCAFAYNDSIKHVIFEKGIDSICDDALQGCSNIKSIYLPDGTNMILDFFSFIYKIDSPYRIEVIVDYGGTWDHLISDWLTGSSTLATCITLTKI